MFKKKPNSDTFYSYSAKRNIRKEELAAYRRIAIASVAIIGLLTAGYFIGVPLIARLGGNEPISSNTAIGTMGSKDTIPPSTPKVDWLPQATNKSSLSVKGTAESGATLVVLNNDQKVASWVVDKEGYFQGKITLQDGVNSLSAKAVDGAGNASRASRPQQVLFDATPPKLVLRKDIPSTTSEDSVTISAATEAGSEVKVNGQSVILADDNSFNLTISLKQETTSITIVATDKAKNQTVIRRQIRKVSDQEESAESSSSAQPDE